MTQEARKNPPAVLPSDLRLADYDRQRFLARPPAGTTLADILNPDFWTHVSRQFRQGGGDIIEIHPADGAFYAEVFVAECRRIGLVNTVRLVKINYVPLTEDVTTKKDAATETYSIVYRGETKKHTVTRNVDKVIVSEGHATKQDAQKWIDEQELSKLTA